MSDLYSSFSVKGKTFKSRFVLPAMQRGLAKDYTPTPDLIEYYRRCASGGAGLIITESVAINHPTSTGHDGFVMMIDEARSAQWQELIQAVKGEGSCILVQLNHTGACRVENSGGPRPDLPSLSPSGLIREGNPNGRAATLEELAELRDAFVDSAMFAKRLGADGVEVHCAHGYLLDQFLWKETNRRTDGYGGVTIGERARFPAEIVRAIREQVGEDFIISVRFSQWKEVDYEARIVETPDELGELLATLRAAGADIFHVSTRRFYLPAWEGSDLSLAGWAKSLTDAAVITVGSVGLSLDVMDTIYTDKAIEGEAERSIRLLETMFEGGQFDLMAVGRSMMGDNDWVSKVMERRYNDIRPFRREIVKQALSEWDDSAITGSSKAGES